MTSGIWVCAWNSGAYWMVNLRRYMWLERGGQRCIGCIACILIVCVVMSACSFFLFLKIWLCLCPCLCPLLLFLPLVDTTLNLSYSYLFVPMWWMNTTFLEHLAAESVDSIEWSLLEEEWNCQNKIISAQIHQQKTYRAPYRRSDQWQWKRLWPPMPMVSRSHC